MSLIRDPTLQDKVSRTTGRGMVRAQAILQAAHSLFVEVGYIGFSMRSVATRAGVSLSNVQHYYPSKESLIEEMLLFAYAEYQQRIDEIFLSLPNASRIDRFKVVVEMLLVEMKKPEVANGIAQTWVMVKQYPAAEKTMARLQARERKSIFKLIQGLSPLISDDEYQVRAALIVAQIEGLAMQFAARDRRPFTTAQLDEAARVSFFRLATEP